MGRGLRTYIGGLPSYEAVGCLYVIVALLRRLKRAFVLFPGKKRVPHMT